jgi:hypothetical protein
MYRKLYRKSHRNVMCTIYTKEIQFGFAGQSNYKTGLVMQDCISTYVWANR